MFSRDCSSISSLKETELIYDEESKSISINAISQSLTTDLIQVSMIKTSESLTASPTRTVSTLVSTSVSSEINRNTFKLDFSTFSAKGHSILR